MILLIICIQSCNKPDQTESKRQDSLAARGVRPPSNPPGEPSLPLAEADTLAEPHYADSLFLRNGELWAVNPASKREQMITETSSQIDQFFISDTRKYVVCLRRVDLIDSPGIYAEGEEPPKEPIHDVLVLNLLSKKSIRQFAVPQDVFVSFDRWISKSRFVFWCNDGFAANATYVYDAYRDSLQEVYYGYPDRRP